MDPQLGLIYFTTGNGAPLINVGRDAQLVANTLWVGKNNMPSFRSQLQPAEIRDVAHYVSEVLFPEHH